MSDDKIIYGEKELGPRVLEVIANKDFTLLLTFDNGEKKVFDVKPYLHYQAFKKLNDWNTFCKVKTDHGTVMWPNEEDFCPDTLYESSVKYEKKQKF